MKLSWIDGFEIIVRQEKGSVIISANSEGLLSLAKHLKKVAEEQPGSHIHLGANNILEEGSSELIIEKIISLKQKADRDTSPVIPLSFGDRYSTISCIISK